MKGKGWKTMQRRAKMQKKRKKCPPNEHEENEKATWPSETQLLGIECDAI
jgi:hypothetical protein